MNNYYEGIIDFFDIRADNWDSCHREEDFSTIDEIITRANISANEQILDVACGTGIFTNGLLAREVKNITGIDISSKMIEIYKQKFPDLFAVTALFEKYDFDQGFFDKIIIFNAFPHFHVPQEIFKKSHKLLHSDGKLIIAHSMSRDELNQHHRCAGKEVENDILISDSDFLALYQKEHFTDIIIDDGKYFYSHGVKIQ